MAVEGEDTEAFVRVLADPYRLALEPAVRAAGTQPRGLGAFADHRDVGLQRQQALDLAVERHVAIPGDDPHPSLLLALAQQRAGAARQPEEPLEDLKADHE